MAFSDRLRQLMQEHNYKQKKLAEKMNVSQQTVSRWVNGQFQPDIEQLMMLGKIFCVSIDDLIGGGDYQKEIKKQPTGQTDELRKWAIERVAGLSDPALVRVRDFLAGLEAGQEIGAAPAAAPDPDDQPSE